MPAVPEANSRSKLSSTTMLFPRFFETVFDMNGPGASMLEYTSILKYTRPLETFGISNISVFCFSPPLLSTTPVAKVESVVDLSR